MQFPTTYVHTRYAAVPAPLNSAAGARPDWNLVLQIISLAYLQLPRHSRFDNLSYESR